MKKLLAAIALTLPALSQAAIIYTDEALFLTDYENPTKSIDFSTLVATKPPVQTSGNKETLPSDSFGGELLFETRQAGDLSWSWTAVDRLDTGGSIFPSDLPYMQGERIGVWSSYHTIVAFHTSAGFFGWVPELGGLDVNDTLFLLPIGAAIDSVEWGFTAKSMEVPEPNNVALLLISMVLILTTRKFKKYKML